MFYNINEMRATRKEKSRGRSREKSEKAKMRSREKRMEKMENSKEKSREGSREKTDKIIRASLSELAWLGLRTLEGPSALYTTVPRTTHSNQDW